MDRREFMAVAFAIPVTRRIISKKLELEFTSLYVTADESQFIDQMKWSVEDIARAFRVPVEYLGVR